MLIKGKTAVITGCNRGIGKALLEVFAKNGANVCVRKPDIDFTEYVEGMVVETGVKIRPVYFDLQDAEQIDENIESQYENLILVGI